MTTYVLLDGDNIQLDVFINDIKPQIEYKYGKIFKIILYCQSNIIFRYQTMRELTLSISCSKTKNKNSTDAQIIYQAGKIVGEDTDNIVVIVSNDQIFNEIVNKNVFLIGNNNCKKLKLNRTNLLNVFDELSKDCKTNLSKDIYLDEFLFYFSKNSVCAIETLINNHIPELCISKSNCVYYRRND
jgi:hypothetical protein